ncbi:hypothetical protein GBA52_004984 [Prunus armeniaca]|nr:hypothetical protein GBA52_004984 [Prunus armeniaca]
MFEYRGTKLLISENAASIMSFRVASDVVSLSGREPLQTDAEIDDDGKLHVVVTLVEFNDLAASNLTGVEIYFVQSSLEMTPRASSFK